MATEIQPTPPPPPPQTVFLQEVYGGLMSESMQCENNYKLNELDKEENKEKLKNLLKPIQDNIKSKFCKPEDASKYIQNIINMPSEVNQMKTDLQALKNNSSSCPTDGNSYSKYTFYGVFVLLCCIIIVLIAVIISMFM